MQISLDKTSFGAVHVVADDDSGDADDDANVDADDDANVDADDEANVDDDDDSGDDADVASPSTVAIIFKSIFAKCKHK